MLTRWLFSGSRWVSCEIHPSRRFGLNLFVTQEAELIAALFDSDGTLYSNQQGRGMLKYLEIHGKAQTARKYLRNFIALRLFVKMKLLKPERFQQITTVRLGWLVKGLNRMAADEMFAWVAKEFLLPSQRPEVGKRLTDHQTNGHQVAIISAMFVPCLERIAGHFDVKDFIGTELESQGGMYTGRIIQPLISGAVKAERARQLFSARNLEVDWKASFAYGDSFSDHNLLELVGHPVAVHPDQKLHHFAVERNWEVLGAPKG